MLRERFIFRLIVILVPVNIIIDYIDYESSENLRYPPPLGLPPGPDTLCSAPCRRPIAPAAGPAAVAIRVTNTAPIST
jgi:hypothetical protein